MKKLILLAVATLLALTNTSFAQIVFDGGPDGTGIDFFEEANWADTVTGADPGANTISPNPVVITSNLTVGGDFAVEGAIANGNIRLDDGLTLTLEDNATLFSQVFSAPANEEFNVVLTDNAELTVTQNIARSAFDISGDADLIFTATGPEFTTDSLNLASDWTGSITVVVGADRLVLQGDSGTGLFDTLTIDGMPATNEDIETAQVGDNIIHTLADSTTTLLGDVNVDDEVNFLDIVPFIAILSNNGFQAEADIDGNGSVNFLDIVPFIAILSGQ